LDFGFIGLGDADGLIARTPSLCNGVSREAAVDGGVDGVDATLNTEDWYDMDDAGVAEDRDVNE
jgi:hypothetical protein